MTDAIIEQFEVDDEGIKDVKILDIVKLKEQGIEDLPAFLNGLLDAENDKEFNDSNKDYIKGYKYAKTGTF